jgi:dihydroorotate dehydrogenase
MSRDILYESLIRSILFALEPELVHQLAASGLGAAAPLLSLLPFTYRKDDLKTDFFGSPIVNPVGLAAGFDKNARLLPVLGNLGFGFAEIGSVCARPHGGNLRPRLFRLPVDHALVNRMGLNGLGAEVVAARIGAATRVSLPFGVNIAKTNDPGLTGELAVKDIVYSFERLSELPVKFVTLNCSCPNTAEGCLQESRLIAEVLERIASLNSKAVPLLVKLSPDSSEEFIADVVRLSSLHKVSGFVCGNTTLKRDGLASDAARLAQIGAGGLSGRPLKPLNLALTRQVARLKRPGQIIIGVGGIESGEDVFDYLSAGAQLVQIYTGFIYRGPAAVKQICLELSGILKSKGMTMAEILERSSKPS